MLLNWGCGLSTDAAYTRTFTVFFNYNLLTPLNEEQSKKCEGVLTDQECYQALKHTDNGKSPGSDGFTCEFYKFFWDYVKQNVVESINYGFEKRQLSICQRRGIITLVPKKRQTDQSPWQPKAYLTSKHRLQNCHESNRKKAGSRSAACDKRRSNRLYQRTVHR